MKPEQKRIVAWMNEQMRRLGWNPQKWAQQAHIHPTSVTRAMSEGYNSVTSVATLEALARAASVPTVLDFLDDQTNGRTPVPTSETLGAVLYKLMPDRDQGEVALVAKRLSAALTLLGPGQPRADDDAVLQIVVDAALQIHPR